MMWRGSWRLLKLEDASIAREEGSNLKDNVNGAQGEGVRRMETPWRYVL